MNIIIESSVYTLSKSKALLTTLTDNLLSDISVPPYYSCIGSHIRHILDFYDCILEGVSSEHINLTNRKRDKKMHNCCDYALINVERVIIGLKEVDGCKLINSYTVEDDLGLGRVKISYTLGAVLAQANSHAIHHYAIINYILDNLGISIEDDTFGYNPTTPKKITLD